jgi:hypothetical protein
MQANQEDMTDHELDQLLGLASNPVPANDAAARAAFSAFGDDQRSNVIQFGSKQKRQRPTIGWLAALPLAASLAAGIYLGTVGFGSYVLPESLGGGVVAEEAAVLSGVEDVEDFADEDVS